jgi:hypothetical protein
VEAALVGLFGLLGVLVGVNLQGRAEARAWLRTRRLESAVAVVEASRETWLIVSRLYVEGAQRHTLPAGGIDEANQALHHLTRAVAVLDLLGPVRLSALGADLSQQHRRLADAVIPDAASRQALWEAAGSDLPASPLARQALDAEQLFRTRAAEVVRPSERRWWRRR